MARPLSELLPAVPEARLIGSADRPVGGIAFWSDEVVPDGLFAAVAGNHVDGHRDIDRAIAAGARTILCAHPPQAPVAGLAYLVASDTAAAMGRIAHAYHGDPSRRMKVVGVTGTNGKTTVATLLHRLFRALGHKAGLLSNIGDYVDGEASAPRYTTGHALFLAEMMARMAAAGCSHCFMEVSSQGIAERRIAGIDHAGAIFTNLSRDHLDYHGTMDGYAAAKKAWFDGLSAASFALVNGDDPRGGWMMEGSAARRLRYGTGAGCDIRLRIVEESMAGLVVEIDERRVRSALLGAFNAANLAAVYGAACLLGVAPDEVAAALAGLAPVPGRMEAIRDEDGRTVIVDFAHTPDAIDKVLRHLRAARPADGRIATVVGCGGGGDVGRRPLIAAAAAGLSDRLILTSDNPRDDDPGAILAGMAAGLSPEQRRTAAIVADRGEAIAAAVAWAEPGDVVLVAGKGHETYQEAAGIRRPFDDRLVARAALGLGRDAAAGITRT